MPTTQTSQKPTNSVKEQKDLEQLLNLLQVYPKHELKSSLEAAEACRHSGQWPLPQQSSSTDSTTHIHTEAQSLEQFSLRYSSERVFSTHPQHKYFTSIFTALVRDRLNNREWILAAPPQNILRVLICLRILMRDSHYQREFHKLGAVTILAQHLHKAVESYMVHGDGPFVVDILKEITNIFQKLSCMEEQRSWLIEAEVEHSLVLLLSASDVIVLHCSLHALNKLAQSPEPRSKIAELNCIEGLLTILQDYDVMSKKLAAQLLLVLCVDPCVREYVKQYDGVPILLSLLHSESAQLLYLVTYCLTHLCKDEACSADVRTSGGIPLILSLLKQDRKFVSERSIANSNWKRTPTVEEEELVLYKRLYSVDDATNKAEELREQSIMLKCACCTCITELVVSDTNAQQVVQYNGIYFLAQLILPRHADSPSIHKLQANAFRALRFLFSLERNRRMFKRLFTAELFEMFIDIGHYKRDLKAYTSLVTNINGLKSEVISELEENIVSLNQEREASHWVGDYAVLEHLGSGAFGSVYRVHKRHASHTHMAMKEINTMSSAFGKNKNERLQSAGNIMTELNVIKEQLKHPNIVKYRQTFFHGERLYIVMDLIEGAPLQEHFNSLKEKKKHFSEVRIWKIFVQIVLALRYLHKDKHIVHRDLTPNNIMLGENDKVTITDFGAAKHKSKDCSKMRSVVGTILYSCPELIQNEPYSEKVDVWALGCILYQMVTLEPPFFSSNIIALAKLIVEARYEPVKENSNSPLIISTIKRCICPDPEERPDIVEVASHISEQILLHMDAQQRDNATLQRTLEKERRRTRSYYSEIGKSSNKYHKMLIVTQDRYDKLVNLQGSGGASGIKDVTDLLSDDSTGSASVRSGATLSDEDSTSSGSDSREGSAGRRYRQHFSQLNLEIIAMTSRDSGIGSGDPSPNNMASQLDSRISSPWEDTNRSRGPILRSVSTPVVDVTSKRTGAKPRPSSAKLTISPDKVRQITDPIQQMLHQLHKIIYISQLPPVLCHSPKRRVIERYKRALFAPPPQSSSINLKTELQKLLTLSRDIIDLNLGHGDSRGQIQRSNVCGSEDEMTLYDTDEDGITYERMHAMIESVLHESGYYQLDCSGNKHDPFQTAFRT